MSKKFRKLIGLLLSSSLVLGMVGCSASGEGEGEGDNTIAFIPPTMVSSFYEQTIAGAKDKANELGYTVSTTAPQKEDDYEGLLKCVEDAITKGAKAIALCTTFFKNKFTARERQSGLTNYVMGLSFITEGAIPFAAADPLKVIPACVIGSATAGALSMAFSCGSRAPHGGIFILPVITNPLMYFVALVVGSIVGGLILGFLKKKKAN